MNQIITRLRGAKAELEAENAELQGRIERLVQNASRQINEKQHELEAAYTKISNLESARAGAEQMYQDLRREYNQFKKAK
jgi:chromosome segregation ATPase